MVKYFAKPLPHFILAKSYRPAKPSYAPKGRRFGRLFRDSRFHLQNFENEVHLRSLLQWLSLTLLVVAEH